MKLKGINPIEQHVEKLVLGVVALVLLGVLVVQFALPAKGVSVGSATDLPPDKALNPVVEEARRALGQMNDAEPGVPDVSSQDLQSAYRDRSARGTVPIERLAAMGSGMELGAFSETAVVAGGTYAMPSLPEPSAPLASAYRGSVHPAEWADSEALRSMLGDEQPFDVGAITVQAFIDGTAIRTALLTDADGDEGANRPLPPSWWRQGFEILGVQLERERRLTDGTWGERTVVESAPGRASMLDELSDANTDDPLLVAQLTQLAAQEMDQITKPSFYRTISGEAWQPPVRALRSDDTGDAEVNRLIRRARGLESDIETLREAMEDDRNTGGRSAPRRPDPRGGGGRGSRGSPQQRNESTSEQREDPRIQRLETMEQQYVEIEEELEDLGYLVDGSKIEGDDFDPEVWGGFEQLFANSNLAMWSHDVTVQGGETYRYRLRPVFNNPAFGQQQALSEEQQQLASSPTFPGPWSGWTEPVQALADTYYFVVNAREESQFGGPQASVEMYTFYYGHYRRATVTASPGDQLYAEARVPEGLRLFDLDNLEQIEDAAAPAPSRQGREVEDPRGRGRGMPGEINPRDDFRSPRSRGDADPRGDRNSGDADADEEVGEPALTRVPIAVDAVLLDVARVPGSGGQREGALTAAEDAFRAFIARTTGERIMVRQPGFDETSSLYEAVRTSWQAGQRALAPEPDPAEEERQRQRQEEREDRRPTRPTGGGGGGGSG